MISAECGARVGERRGAYRLGQKDLREGNNLESPRHRIGDGIKMDLQEMGCVDIDWIDLARNRGRWRALVNVVVNFRIS